MPSIVQNGVTYASSMAAFTDNSDDATWPAGILQDTQCVVAFRFRPDWSHDGIAGWNPKFVDWRNSTHLIICEFVNATDKFRLYYSDGTVDAIEHSLVAFNGGDDLTLIFQWDQGTETSISINGGTLETNSVTISPAMAAVVAYLGNRSPTHNEGADGQFHWVAAGTGYIDSTDAAAIHAFGNADPNWGDFPAAFGINFLWKCNDDTYEDAPPTQDISPATDIADGAWQPSTGVDLYAVIDEVTLDTGDYIYSADSPVSADICEVKFEAASDPNVHTDHLIKYTYAKNADVGDQIDLTVRLVQGTTVIASWQHTNIGNTPVTAEQTLLEAEAATITDYSDLRLRFEAITP